MVFSYIKKIQNFFLSISGNIIALLGLVTIVYIAVDVPSDFLSKKLFNLIKTNQQIVIFLENKDSKIKEIFNSIMENRKNQNIKISFTEKISESDIIALNDYRCFDGIGVEKNTSISCNNQISELKILPITGMVTYKFPNMFIFNNQVFHFKNEEEDCYIAVAKNEQIDQIQDILDVLANINNLQ